MVRLSINFTCILMHNRINFKIIHFFYTIYWIIKMTWNYYNIFNINYDYIGDNREHMNHQHNLSVIWVVLFYTTIEDFINIMVSNRLSKTISYNMLCLSLCQNLLPHSTKIKKKKKNHCLYSVFNSIKWTATKFMTPIHCPF